MNKQANSKISIFDKYPVQIIGLIYTLTAVIIVSSAWITGLFPYDLRLTISIYTALRPWTAIMYLAVAVVMTFTGVRYIRNTVRGLFRQIVYYIVFAGVFTCAACPYNEEWSRITADIHNAAATVLMLSVTVSFVIMLVTGKRKVQKIFSLSAIAFAAFFILSYLVLHFRFFYMTLFIWENLFIYLLLAEMYLERFSKDT